MTLIGASTPTSMRARLQRTFAAALRRARAHERPVLATVLLPAPAIDLPAAYNAAESIAETRAVWSSPNGGPSLVALDAVWSYEGPPAQAAAAWRELIGAAVIDAPDEPAEADPMLLAGFAFDPLRPATPDWARYPAGLAFVPRLLYASADGASQVRISALIASGADIDRETNSACALLDRLRRADPPEQVAGPPSRADELLPAARWRQIVAGALGDFDRLGLEKVVLARATHVLGAAPFQIGGILRHLRAAYPSCFVFAFSRGDRCFLGATPEQLVSLRRGRIDAISLAGTIGRGRDDREDVALTARLVASAKDQSEHRIVVRAMRQALACAGARDIIGGRPTVLKLPNVQHLQTHLSARPAPGTGVLDFVAHLHPTPAVGGYPREPALQLIREREELDRGWYAGPVGWVDAAGEGEFAVALRSALVWQNEALLFAGCGIVPGSNPAEEFAESCLKLRPMLTALGVPNSADISATRKEAPA